MSTAIELEKDFGRPNPGRDKAPKQLLLRVSEAAMCLGISRSKLYELMAAGAIESVSLGRSRRIPFECLEAYVAMLRGRNNDRPGDLDMGGLDQPRCPGATNA